MLEVNPGDKWYMITFSSQSVSRYACSADAGGAAAPSQATPSGAQGHPAPPPLGATSQKWHVKLLRAEIVDDVFTGQPYRLPCKGNQSWCQHQLTHQDHAVFCAL